MKVKNRDRDFQERIERSIKSYKESKTKKKGTWTYIYRVTVIGWLFVLPVIAGAYFGRYLDRKSVSDVSWTITFIIIGIAVGIYNVWHFMGDRK